jgi:hypothetical protein
MEGFSGLDFSSVSPSSSYLILYVFLFIAALLTPHAPLCFDSEHQEDGDEEDSDWGLMWRLRPAAQGEEGDGLATTNMPCLISSSRGGCSAPQRVLFFAPILPLYLQIDQPRLTCRLDLNMALLYAIMALAATFAIFFSL